MIKILNHRPEKVLLVLVLLSSGVSSYSSVSVGERNHVFVYTVRVNDPSFHIFNVELQCGGLPEDTIEMKMPAWMPGYYQIMDYARDVSDFSVTDNSGRKVSFQKPDSSTWRIVIRKSEPFVVNYKVRAEKRFVANSFLDDSHGYLIPESAFLYMDGYLKNAVTVNIISYGQWKNIVTGLDPEPGKDGWYSAPDFDVLYDCPILMGNLDELPAFSVRGVGHRFVGFGMGSLDGKSFMANIQKIVAAGTDLIGEVPYSQYTFIGIGPGRGGIEHLNNTTVSFTGTGLDNSQNMSRILYFLAHEYFHNFNVKRIRPYELGPFMYDRENRTNLLWMSEGLTVYYEYMLVRKAGLASLQDLFTDFEGNINAVENDTGRFYQSLTQSSYNTWTDWPFGRQGKEGDRSISYYDKGPVVGLILELAIRHASGNKRSLDDVMRYLYYEYYKKMGRGFTDAEFQQACELMAGCSLSPEFEYVNTTKDIDYNFYLNYAGLYLTEVQGQEGGKRRFSIQRLENISNEQQDILKSWSGE